MWTTRVRPWLMIRHNQLTRHLNKFSFKETIRCHRDSENRRSCDAFINKEVYKIMVTREVTVRWLQLLTYFSTAVAFSVERGLFLCWKIKSPPEWQMVDQAHWGERRKNAVPQSQKCLGPEVREASALARGDIALLGETCCRGVCCLAFQHVGGSLSQIGLTFKQRRSITVSVGCHTVGHECTHSWHTPLITSVSRDDWEFYTKIVTDYLLFYHENVRCKSRETSKPFLTLLQLSAKWKCRGTRDC